MSIISVVGARPNFMKMAPVISELKKSGHNPILVHTGQHYDKNMSQIFFEQLELPDPDISLKIGSGSHAEMTAKVLVEFEKICYNQNPKLVIVAGDVNSTLACALAASKLDIPVAHIESGLRSFDNRMPEEINRILTDRLSEFLFVTEKQGIKNLKNEGMDLKKIYFVGNCMIDSLCKFLPITKKEKYWEKFNLQKNNYGLVTLHRPSNVDTPQKLNSLIILLNKMANKLKIIFPIHPRTKKTLKMINEKISNDITIVDPLPYHQFLGLMSQAKLVMTDSGGVQEETTFLGVQCITLRENTERPITIDLGTNHLSGTDNDKIFKIFENILHGDLKNGKIPPKWDGCAGKRIAKIVDNYLSEKLT